MTDTDHADSRSIEEAEETGRETKPRRNYFRRSNSPKLAVDAASRQGQVTKLAFERLGGKDAAIAYLNLESDRLGGRPLDLATASAEGLAQVERDLAHMASSD
jgi:Protein of unknown function (DUF2384).